jgi:hypothetical protein
VSDLASVIGNQNLMLRVGVELGLQCRLASEANADAGKAVGANGANILPLHFLRLA